MTVALVADTSLVVTLDGTASDHAAQAARCALLVKQRWEQATVTLATAREVIDTHPVGEAIDRAWALFGGRSPAPTARAVHIDAPTAGLLDACFDLGPAPDGAHWLHGERTRGDVTRDCAV